MTATVQVHKPFRSGVNMSGRFGWAKAINWSWWLKRLPMILLAAPSAWGVGAFAYSNLPLQVAFIAGLAFESTYIGAIAVADHQHDENDGWTGFLWWCVNLFAVIASVLCNLLFFSGGGYAAITPEVATHGIPLPVLGFFYGLLLHRTSVKASLKAQRDAEVAEGQARTQRERDEAEQRENELRARYTCPKCQRGFTSPQSLSNHKKRCVAVSMSV